MAAASATQKIIVTGGCGFFGAAIVKHLLSTGDSVTVVDLAAPTKWWHALMTPEEIARVSFAKLGVDTEEFVALVVATAPDAVIHLAGLQIPTCRGNPVLGARVNVIGTLNVFEAARQLQAAQPGKAVMRIVYASSAAIFGPDADYGDAPAGDTSNPNPSSHYGAYKLCGEHCAKAYWLDYKIPSVGLRPLTVYGPGRDMGLTSFPTRAVASAIMGQPFDIPFSGPTVYVHVAEIADIFVQCAKRPAKEGKVYTIGGDTVDTKGFVEALEAALPGAAQLITISGGNIPIASRLDDAALRADFPGLLRIPLQEGIARTVEVYKAMHAKGTLSA